MKELISAIIIASCGIISLFIKNRKVNFSTGISGIILAVALLQKNEFMTHEFIYDKTSYIFSLFILLISIPVLILLYLETANFSSSQALFMFSIASSMLLTSTKNLILFIIMLETLSLSTIILTGSRKDYPALEGCLKYFLIGAISTGLTVYGASLYYLGSRELIIKTPQDLIQKTGIILIFAGFAFKAGFFPLHFWIPDAYTSSYASVAMLLSTIPKFAITASFLRFFGSEVGNLVVASATLGVIYSNMVALRQNNLRRLMAYSTISHMSFLLLLLYAGFYTVIQQTALIYYLTAYSAATIAIWLYIYLRNINDINETKGLAQIELFYSIAIFIAFISLTGLPPLAGFIAKFVVLKYLVSAKFYILSIVVVIASIISLYYYLYIPANTFFKQAEFTHPVKSYTSKIVLIAMTVIVLWLGINPFILND